MIKLLVPANAIYLFKMHVAYKKGTIFISIFNSETKFYESYDISVYFVQLLHREADLIDQTLRPVTEEQILQEHRTKFGRLQQKLQGLWE